MKTPILYSFKRCPYAMRARMAIKLANISCEIREIKLNNKPDHMLEVSPKGTVPVLILENKIIDESNEIIKWALDQVDVFEGNLNKYELNLSEELINIFDVKFKFHLDRYKYANRYDDFSKKDHRSECMKILDKLNVRISNEKWIFGKNIIQMSSLIEAIESMTGASMPEKYKTTFLEGTNEIDLIRSGLDDMMIDGFQEVKKEFKKNEKIPDFRTAAYKVAIEKIAMSYDSIGL